MIDMKIKTLLGVALVAGTLASCSVEDNESAASKVKEDYTREFIKQFGTINPNQDWSVVEQKNVIVDLPTASHVKIYEKQGGEYRLAADYKDVTKQTITFDGLEGDDTPFLVCIDGIPYAAENGQTIKITSSNSGIARASEVPSGSDFIKRGEAKDIKLNSADKAMKVLAEENGTNHAETSAVDEFNKNNGGVEVLQKGQSVSFYPMYWNSKNVHHVGLYYYDKGVRIEVPMYVDKPETGENGDLGFYTKTDIAHVKAYPAETDAENCWNYTHTPSALHWGGKWSVEYKEGFTFNSRPYIITPTTESLAAGIYVEVNGKKYYSQSSLNGGKTFFAEKCIVTSDGTDETYTYLCFDDPDENGNEGDKDYNDLVFYTPRIMSPASEDELQWTIACEDLGGTFDYDFNDLVFRVKHTSGNNFATIIPMAAGGTLPAYLYYNNTKISEEWHQHFGNGYESTVMINTGRGETTSVIWPIRIEGLATDWSINAFSKKDGGLNIKVERADGTQTTVTGPDSGAAPQMLILPYDWQWPTELTRITSAYPDFGTWGSNYTNSSWVNNTVDENLYPAIAEKEVTATKGAKTTTVH